MYHDEFEMEPARRPSAVEEKLAGLAFEVGGGVTLGLLASFDRHASSALFLLGGLLPLVACSLGILAHRVAEILGRPARPAEVDPSRRLAIPGPMLALRGPRNALARPALARAGFDRSRRLD
jgi:hypothetical protein